MLLPFRIDGDQIPHSGEGRVSSSRAIGRTLMDRSVEPIGDGNEQVHRTAKPPMLYRKKGTDRSRRVLAALIKDLRADG